MAKILVLDDEASIRGFIAINLQRNNWEVIEAATGEEALQLAHEHPDIQIALLDILLPGIDGIQVCQELRQLYPRMGLIMLTAKGQEQDKVLGLETGADDYIVKPFSPKELVARIRALLRRVSLPNSVPGGMQDLVSPPFVLRMGEYKLYKNDSSISLTPTELAMVQVLLQKKGQAVSRNELLDGVWGPDYFGDPKIVDVNIRRLRLKIEDDPSCPRYIATVWGYGYCWNGEQLA